MYRNGEPGWNMHVASRVAEEGVDRGRVEQVALELIHRDLDRGQFQQGVLLHHSRPGEELERPTGSTAILRERNNFQTRKVSTVHDAILAVNENGIRFT